MADNNLFELSGTVELETDDFEKSADEVSEKLDELLIKLVAVEKQAKKTFEGIKFPNTNSTPGTQPGSQPTTAQPSSSPVLINAPQSSQGKLTSGSGEPPGEYLPSGNPSGGDLPSVSVKPEAEQRTSYSTPDAIDLDDYWNNRRESGSQEFDFDIPVGEIAEGAGQIFGWKKDLLVSAGGTFIGNLASDTAHDIGEVFSGENSLKVNVEFPDAKTLQEQLNEIVSENPLFVPVNAVLQNPEQKIETEASTSEVVENEPVSEHVQIGPLTNEDYEKIEGDRYIHPKWTWEYGFFTPKLDSDQWSAAIGGREFIYPHVDNNGNSDGFIGLTLDDRKRINKNPDIYKNVRNEQDLFYNLNNYLPFTYSPGDTVPVTDIGSGGVNDLLPWLQEKFPDFNFEIVPEIPEEAEENLQSSLNGFGLKLPVTPVISGSLGGYDWGAALGNADGSGPQPINIGGEMKRALSGMSVTLNDNLVGVVSESLGRQIVGSV